MESVMGIAERICKRVGLLKELSMDVYFVDFT